MIRVFPFATALAAITAICYLLGMLLAVAAPSLFLALMQAWLLLDMTRLGGPLVTLPLFIIGLVTLTIGSWLFGWAWAVLYNMLAAAQKVRA